MDTPSHILGTGIDLVENARIAASIEKLGEPFLRRIFTAGEIEYCQKMRNPAPHFAARFAAKEAVSKAFGSGIGEQLSWLDMEVTRDALGAPSVLLHGGGKALATTRGVQRIFLSLSHTEHYAVASATLVG